MVTEHAGDFKAQITRFHDLMKFRVTEILLVSTPYDGFVLEEDGRLSERIYNEYFDLSIYFVPRIHRVSCGLEALEVLREKTYHLVITMSRISDMSPFELAGRIKELYPELPVVMLSYERLSAEMIARVRESKAIDRVFYWTGDSKILVATIKYVEDRQNVEEDCRQGVQVILVVEDSPVYYSQFLPIIYTEIMKQTRYLVSHAVNSSHRLLRVRARPKILLAETYEEAVSIIEKYKHNLLGVISDVRFPRGGEINPTAGIELARKVRETLPDIPFLLQSEEKENEEIARRLQVTYLDKNTPALLLELRAYIMDSYGFGAFEFKNKEGEVIGVATDITHLEKLVAEVPDDVLYYHASNNHFSRWFRARTEFETAEELRRLDAKSFSSTAEIREQILEIIRNFFKRYQSGVILDFGLSKMDMENAFIKLGSGSLGGKARGIAFFNSLLSEARLDEKYPGVKIKTPRSFVVCSEVFEQFIEDNELNDFLAASSSEEEIAKKFLASELTREIKNNLLTLIRNAGYPLAVRSSSLLEDSQVLPFAGIYKTYILPNNHRSTRVRFKQVSDAVKLIYASVFYDSPRQYARNADIRIEEERMAVLIQELVGEQYGDLYYPVVSGVAQSYNFYPYSHLKPEDGMASLALGFGRMIVEGGQVYRFSPAYPRMNPPYANPGEFLKKSQSMFYALNLKKSSSAQLNPDDSCNYEKHPLSRAEEDRTLEYVGSTYSPENDCIFDHLHINGPRLVTFSPILKHGLFPLAEIIKDLFELGKSSFGSEVEIEFAVNIPKDKTKPKEFYFLQIRPMVVGREPVQVKIESPGGDRSMLCVSRHTIGNGVFQNIHDLIFIDPNLFELEKTVQIAAEIGELNKVLSEEKRKCILIGFGRMGTADRWLGIPLAWSQMSQARVVVEADRIDLQSEPSLGSHFYHNLISLNMGYLHVQHDGGAEERIDWDWLLAQPVCRRTNYVRLIRSDRPFITIIDGKSSTGIIMKS
ncbi:MAG: PEP/pyruvate-binding domain-containing protein [Peptococcaceae bacterium]|nr:phosphoenolpyruvate synthase [Peptococcaceae bacterium]MDH7524668.1 PEP/pyruvate-binding domain-containing protein [Peptococcaceae bacterium]